ncbi:MAG: heat-shock protein [Henriciella sp.]|jgi:molecular chaperone IbpA|uniref:Hsp20 family protein n=1 Tax=Henriciella sp. TaxID=1968823 RepID=UPI000C0DDEF5|nr:Hsp20 family protein [Henriciella sp.]MAN74967.1 heat-shock protein [Henriciella sp.]MBF33836.1 heat-shock protein [Hyphomonadaceae bacterium]MBK74404.1 heat-shock protein [Henriciella sp.]PHR74838.1 MAG: heat-shock protein [Henriciella sp.]|tara:strand:+ start:532 stop:1008 length:477 start_codon:yes stop_codon:yes gene_type:complete
MSTIDLTPLYRTMVGFDRMANLIDSASRLDGTQGYPPYNIERVADDAFAIEIAVAGFSEDDLEIETNENLLTVAGKKSSSEDGEERQYLHRGIAERGFLRRFQLADHVIVTGASLQNGLLRIELLRELPEAKKPRKIEIGSSSQPKSKPKLIGKQSAA